jgi:hypothetical protein
VKGRMATLVLLACAVVQAVPTARTLWAEYRSSHPETPCVPPCDPPGFSSMLREVNDEVRRLTGAP